MNITTAVVFCICILGSISLAMAEPQPHMAAALNHLESAQNQLRRADNDKGSHRERALELIQAAMGEVRQGIEFDNQHKEDRTQRGDRQYGNPLGQLNRGHRERHPRGEW
ncbi:exported hypothetical protein [Gammaproteobacteria bacterium]